MNLVSPVVLVPSGNLADRLRRLRRDHPQLPTGLNDLLSDLAARPDGVPAVVEPPRPGYTGDSLVLVTATYVARLRRSGRDDAYTVVWIGPLKLQDHRRLGQGFLLLRARWMGAHELRAVPPGSSTQWEQVEAHWRRLLADLGARNQAPGLSPAHNRLLDLVDQVIDLKYQQAMREASAPGYPYRSVEPAGERRYSGAPVYLFQVVGDRVPRRKESVQLHGEPDQRGHVIRVDGNQVTIRFDNPVSWDRLGRQGELEAVTGNAISARQRAAVDRLRTGRAANPMLLPVLVDHRTGPLVPVTALPSEALDEDQLEAFRKALAVPDVLLVLGPPGTGKTRTISQIAHAHAQRPDHGPVLVTSHTNRAVDNVLGKLPATLVVIRVGSESRVDAEGRPYLLETLATELRGEILSTTQTVLSGYAGLPVAEQWAAELGRCLSALGQAGAAVDRAWADLTSIRRVHGGAAQAELDQIVSWLREQEGQAARRHELLGKLQRREARARARPPWWRLIGWDRWPARSRARKADRYRAELARLVESATGLRARAAEAAATLDAVTRQVPAVQAAQARVTEALRHRHGFQGAALHAATAVRRAIGPAAVLPPAPGPDDATQVLRELSGWHAGLARLIPVLHARARLLREWREEAAGDSDQLYPELIRYADVIGATCIGAATSRDIAGTEFDLAIVDESGQIDTATLLVPLVRAKRAVLVGDHRQLPPVVDSDIRAQDEAVRELVTTSTLEMLVDRLPPSNVVSLTQQRRMPRIIADFVSDAFYGGALKTMVERAHHDVLFAQPLAFVDTSELPERQRWETAAQPKGPRGSGGYVNDAEAHLLVRLATFYHRRGEEWALIVPYTAQIALISRLLGEEITDTDIIDTNVGTVDSFQGGERDVILYGFTRSNGQGSVGFLDELRRANVAFTRAKHQLVLVGDLETLTNTREPGFRTLARSLRDRVAAEGDLRGYHEVLARIDVAVGQEDRA